MGVSFLDGSRASCALGCVALLLFVAGCGKTDSAPAKEEKVSESGVDLTGAQMKNLGIATVPARAANWRRNISGYGVVVALDTVAQTDADVATASAAAAQSSAAASRARSLATGEDAAVSREVAEVATAKAATDRAALALAQRKAQAAFGLNAPWRTPAEQAGVMAKLSAGRAVLVRVTFPLGALAGARPKQIAIARLGGSAQVWESTHLWDAPADPALPGQGFYCLLEGSDLAQNEHVTGTIDVGPATAGVFVPQSAVLIGESDTWVFTEPKPGHFEKMRMDIGKPQPGGYFAGKEAGVMAGVPLVTGGAGLLLAREANPATDAGD
jgi:hypothetical protein